MKTYLHKSPRSKIWKFEPVCSPAYVCKKFRANSSESSLEIGIHCRLIDIDGVVLVKDFAYGATPRLIMEWCQEGSIREYVINRGFIPESELLRMFGSMSGTLRQIHERRIVHRAISYDNLLVTRDLMVKFTDFGHFKLLSVGESHLPNSLPNEQGTKDHSYHIFAEDVRRLGKVCFQMAVGDFEVKVFKMTISAIEEACRVRGYTYLVAKVIQRLLGTNLTRQEEIGERLLTLEDPVGQGLDFEEPRPCCDNCNEASLNLELSECEHLFCRVCVKRIKRLCGAMECPMCRGDTFSQSISGVVSANDYQFP